MIRREVQVHQRGVDVLVTEYLLKLRELDSVLEQLRSKGVAEGMDAGSKSVL